NSVDSRADGAVDVTGGGGDGFYRLAAGNRDRSSVDGRSGGWGGAVGGVVDGGPGGAVADGHGLDRGIGSCCGAKGGRGNRRSGIGKRFSVAGAVGGGRGNVHRAAAAWRVSCNCGRGAGGWSYRSRAERH